MVSSDRGGRGQSSESGSSARVALRPCYPVVCRGRVRAVVVWVRSSETTKKTRKVYMEGGKWGGWGKVRSEGGAGERRAGVWEGGRGRGTHPVESSVRMRRKGLLCSWGRVRGSIETIVR